MRDPRNTAPSQALPLRYGVIAVVHRDERFLVIRRSATVAAPRMFCFPGGGIEPNESEPEALVREIREELGVPIRPVRRLWRNVTRWQVDLAWWLGVIAPDVPFAPNPAEVESMHWMRAEEILSLDNLLESNRHFFEALARGEFNFELTPPPAP
jgi:8-oxo-dGTP diphosphatase